MSSTLLLAVITIAGTFGYMIFMRRRLHAQYAHMRAGELVPRLGLRLVEGNPAHNLVTESVQPAVQNATSARGLLTQVAAAELGGTLGEFKLHAVGQPYDTPAELVLYCRQELSPGLTCVTTTTWHDLRLTAHARAEVTPFELRLRTEHAELEARRADDAPRLPARAFGDPGLDQRYLIATPDPTLPRRLAGALAPLGQLAYVHLVGDGHQVSFVMTPASVNASALALEDVLRVVASIAALADGRPMPGVIAGPAAQAHA